jgi:hypothetical protein
MDKLLRDMASLPGAIAKNAGSGRAAASDNPDKVFGE